MSLLVSGTVALDNIKTPYGYRKQMLGGSASHFCMSAALFTKVYLTGVVGEDFPLRYLNLFRRKQIDLSCLQRQPGETFGWDGEYQKGRLDHAVTHATRLGVLQGFVPQIAKEQRKIRNIFLANDDPDIQTQSLEAMEKPRLIGLDSMNLWIESKKKSLFSLIHRIDLLVINENEAKMMTQEQNLIKASKALRKLGPRLIVVKKGEHGVLFYSDSLMFSFPAFPIEKVIDPTGAGDTFAGGLMGCLAQSRRFDKKALKRAVLCGCVVASFNVEGFGVQRTSCLTLQQVHQRKKAFLKFIS